MDGKANGRGKCIEKKSLGGAVDGDVYDGEWKNDKMNGRGKFTQVNCHVYDGEYKDGKKNGQGKITYLKIGRAHV